MHKLKVLLNAPYRVTPDFRQVSNYLVAYLMGITAFAVLILSNCRIIWGQFYFVWDTLSWYITICYLFLFPLEMIYSAKIAANHRKHHNLTPTTISHQSKPVSYPIITRIIFTISTVTPSSHSISTTLIIIFGIPLAPILLLGLMATAALTASDRFTG